VSLAKQGHAPLAACRDHCQPRRRNIVGVFVLFDEPLNRLPCRKSLAANLRRLKVRRWLGLVHFRTVVTVT
jgi:hypothetical protein